MGNYNSIVEHDEDILHVVTPRPSTKTLIIVAILTLGIPTVYYIYSVRNRPDYLVTSKRIIKTDQEQSLESWDYPDLNQVQIGQNWFEKFQNRGNITIITNNSGVEQISDVDDHSMVAETIGEHIV